MKKSVLIIDDESDLCELISMVLKKQGYEVDCAFTLAQAAEKLQSHPGFVFLDNNLPDGSGLEYIHMHPIDFMESFVVMITADPSEALQKDAAHEGVRAFLSKPFSLERMKNLVSHYS